MKKKLTSKEWLFIAISIFLSLIVFVAGLGMDASHSVLAKKNIFEGIAKLLQIPMASMSSNILIMLLFLCLFLILFPISILVIKRSLTARDENIKSTKAWILYCSTFIGALILCFGIGTLFQIPNEGMKTFSVTLEYVFGAFAVGLIIFAVIALFIYGVVGIIYYFFINKRSVKDDSLVQPTEEEKEDTNKGDLSGSFTGVGSSNTSQIVANATNSATNGSIDGGSIIGSRIIGPKNEVFKNLVAIDEDTTLVTSNDFVNEDLNLEKLVDGLQGYLAKNEHLYYNKKELADFIAGMSASKLIILEGISGTGKSSLPRFFAKYIGEEAFFEPIQVTYKEKSDILGFYNELTGKYNETPFLKRLYRAGYENNKINLMVLDEMNISRVEYYFADFLSVMEFPVDQRYVSLMTLPDDYDCPINLTHGDLLITPNTYFIGTANKDDSTFTITDKVIDRAIVINFDETQKELDIEGVFDPITLSFNELNDMFAKARVEHPLTNDEKNKFLTLLDYIANELGIVTGNRIIKQIENMAPVYISMGLDVTDCLDTILANKILRKLESKFDLGLQNQLIKLTKKIDELYGDKSFASSRKLISKLIRRLG